MALFFDSPDRKRDKSFAQVGLLTTVPGILIAGPLIGFFAGKWVDSLLGTKPYLMLVGIGMGLAASGIEIYRVLKKAEHLEDDKDSD